MTSPSEASAGNLPPDDQTPSSEAQTNTLIEALEFYADPEKWKKTLGKYRHEMCSPAQAEMGSRARSALSAISKGKTSDDR